jgi:putative transcriptional regulator
MKLTEQQIKKRDAQRDIGAEILQSIRDLKAGKGRKIATASQPIIAARQKVSMTQTQFAQMLGVSLRTLQDWEQGRRRPSGAAQSLLLIAEKKPAVLREIFSGVSKAA